MVAFPERMTADKKSNQQEEKLTTYCEVYSYLLETFATDDVIAEAEAEYQQLQATFRDARCAILASSITEGT